MYLEPALPPLLGLPTEILYAILSYLEPWELARIFPTCRLLKQHAESEPLWQPLVQEQIPDLRLRKPGPFSSFCQLYAAFDRVWFLTKYKIWFGDTEATGKLLLAKYDPERGCIEGYQLVAAKSSTFPSSDDELDQPGFPPFNPIVKLHIERPVLRFDDGPPSLSTTKSDLVNPEANRYADEMPMMLEQRSKGMFSNFSLTRACSDDDLEEHDGGNVWPPQHFPVRQHVASVCPGQTHIDLPANSKPACRSDVYDKAFRLRHWMEMNGGPLRMLASTGQTMHTPGDTNVHQDPDTFNPMYLARMTQAVRMGFRRGRLFGTNIGEEMTTYSTLEPKAYRPTKTRPWRGIWVGDYNGHGCEFLLVAQPDMGGDLELIRKDTETEEEWQERQREAQMYRGPLVGLKLTGDPNIPRGQPSFIAEDLGPQGLIGHSDMHPFEGSRIVQSRGHYADHGFTNDRYTECHLILISENKLAQHWVRWNRTTFYNRVDIDNL